MNQQNQENQDNQSTDETQIQIIAGKGMESIAQKTYAILTENEENKQKFGYTEVSYTQFANNEIKPKIPVPIRQKDVYLFHAGFHPDPNQGMMELLLTNDAISRASAKSITLVLPYMPYLRQDRKDEPRVPISAKLMADLVQTNSKVERILTMDLHCDQAQGFYQIPVDKLYGSLVHSAYFKEKYDNDFSNLIVMSPDHGGVKRARRFARTLDESVPVYMIDKRRTGANQCEVMNFVGGSVKGKDIIIFDDMIDTGGSMLAAYKVAKERGANKVYACVTHGLFSTKKGAQQSTEERFRDEGLEVVIAETIPLSQEYKEQNKNWLTALPIEGLLEKAIYQASKVGGSISSLFEE